MENLNQNLTIINFIGNGIICVFGAICIITSSLLLYICSTKLTSKSTEIRFIFIFGLIQLITGIIIQAMSIYKLSTGYLSFSKGSDACLWFAYFIDCIQRINLELVLILSIMRYLLACKNTQLKIWIWLLIQLTLISIPITLYSIGLSNNATEPTPSYLTCTTFPLNSSLPADFSIVSTLLYFIPCLLSTIFYSIVINSSILNLNHNRQIALLFKNYTLIESIKFERLKLVLQFSLVIILLNLNFIPYYIAWLVEYFAGIKLGPIWDCVSQILVCASFCGLQGIVISFQPQVYNEFNLLLLKLRVNFGN